MYRELIPYAGKEPPPLPGAPSRDPMPGARAKENAQRAARAAEREAKVYANSTIERLDAVLVDVPPRRARIILKLLDARLCIRIHANIEAAALEVLAPGTPGTPEKEPTQ